MVNLTWDQRETSKGRVVVPSWKGQILLYRELLFQSLVSLVMSALFPNRDAIGFCAGQFFVMQDSLVLPSSLLGPWHPWCPGALISATKNIPQTLPTFPQEAGSTERDVKSSQWVTNGIL